MASIVFELFLWGISFVLIKGFNHLESSMRGFCETKEQQRDRRVNINFDFSRHFMIYPQISCKTLCLRYANIRKTDQDDLAFLTVGGVLHCKKKEDGPQAEGRDAGKSNIQGGFLIVPPKFSGGCNLFLCWHRKSDCTIEKKHPVGVDYQGVSKNQKYFFETWRLNTHCLYV